MISLSRVSAPLLLLGALAMAACAPSTTGSGNAGTAPSPNTRSIDVNQPVVVAFLAPSTAANAGAANLGRSLVNAARMAAVDAKDPTLQLKFYDTRGEAGAARTAVEQAVADGAQLILGPLFGANTRAIASVAAREQLKVISFSTDSTVAGDPVYLSGFLPEIEAKRISQFARARGLNALGVLHRSDSYGAVSLAGAQASGVPIVASTEYERTTPGITTGVNQFARQARQNGARAVLLADSGQALRLIGSLMTTNGVGQPGTKYLGLGQWDSKITLQEPSLRGGWFPAPDPAALRRFVTKYRQAYGAVPPSLAVLGYDAVQIAAQMLANARATGSSNPFDTAALTRPQGFRGAVGPVRFNSDGRGERAMAILEVGERNFNVLDPAPAVFAAGS
ncbi:MAG: penicillin-binding protein activator [Pseudomonadota bacterium]